MAWPIVMFSGEVVYFEWKCVDDATNETIAKGNVTYLRRGHRGGCHLKTEQLHRIAWSPYIYSLGSWVGFLGSDSSLITFTIP